MPKELFDGVYSIEGKLATLNKAIGTKVYNEELVSIENKEYRLWNPYRSKLAAAILKGLKNFQIKKDSKILYIGAATGTTSSHVSDIAYDGKVFCIELSERNMRELLNVCEKRENMFPILADANNIEEYSDSVGECDIIYQDVSARNQSEILNKNSIMLKKNGYAYFIIKSQSIDISKDPKTVFQEELANLSKNFKIHEKIDLEPFDSMHMFAVLSKL
jgi:fibrillarin-like pre-rRNA processing protein